MARVLPWRVEQAPWLAAPETAGDRIQLWPRVRGALCLRTQTPHPGPKQRLEAGAGSHGGHKEVSVEALPCSAQLESQGGLQKGIDSGFGVWGLFWFFFFFLEKSNQQRVCHPEGRFQKPQESSHLFDLDYAPSRSSLLSPQQVKEGSGLFQGKLRPGSREGLGRLG